MKPCFNKKLPSIRRACLLAALSLGLLPGAVAALQVWVTLEPQAFVVERIGGDAVEVRVLVPPGRSPATYAPAPSEVASLARSDLLFGIGVPAERRLLERMREALKRVRVIDSQAWRLPSPHEEGGGKHQKDPEACPGCAVRGTDGQMTDPHLWMDPLQMLAFSEHVTEELSARKPAMADKFAVRGAALRKELTALDKEIEVRLRPFAGQAFFINHASLAHYAARYDLRQRSVEQVGSQPSARRVAEMIQEAEAAGAGAILAQPQFSRSTADILAQALDLPVLPVDPLRRDYPGNLLEITEGLQQALAGKKKEGAE